MEYKIVLGIIASAMAIIGYIPYISNIIKGKTKPHIYSWIVWFIIAALTCIIQFQDDGGPGAWVTGFIALSSLAIVILAIKKGEKNITKNDTLALTLSLISIIVRWFMKNPLLAMIIVVIAEGLGFYPTRRKSRIKPQEETVSIYVIASIRSVLAIIALNNLSLITVMYPAFIVISCTGFSIFLLVRRRQLGL